MHIYGEKVYLVLLRAEEGFFNRVKLIHSAFKHQLLLYGFLTFL